MNNATENSDSYNAPQQDLPTGDFNPFQPVACRQFMLEDLGELLVSQQDRRLFDFVVEGFKHGLRIGFTATPYVTAA